MYDVANLEKSYGGFTSPAYRLASQCFLQKPGRPPQLFEEGDEIVWDLTPNHEMVPLNKAAGAAWNKWEESLPPEASQVSPEDLVNASHVISARYAGQPTPPAGLWHQEVFEQAVKMRAMREGRSFPSSPSRQAPALSRPDGRTLPPMSAGDFKEVGFHADPRINDMRGPQQEASATQIRRRPVAPQAPMSTEPPPPAGDAVGM